MRKKTLTFETWKANPTDSNRQAYRCARNRAISTFRRAKAAHILRVSEDLNSSSPSHRSWWHTVRQVTGRAVSSVSTLIANNKLHHSPVEKVKVLNSYMADQNSVPNPGAPLPPFHPTLTRLPLLLIVSSVNYPSSTLRKQLVQLLVSSSNVLQRLQSHWPIFLH